jgi:hypothetical protein
MARQRHTANSIKRERAAQREEKHLADLRFLSKRGRRPDPDNYKAVARAARLLRARESLEKHYTQRVSKDKRELLKSRGFHTTKKGVVIDGPRDARRKRISGAKMSVLKDGTVKWSVGQRRDFIYGMTKTEKKAFAANPELFTKQILERLRASNPTLKGIRPSRIQTRIQWGSFQATKDFAPRHFARMKSGEAIIKNEAIPGNGRSARDVLTGLHFVVHVPVKRKKVKHDKRKKHA